MKKKTILICWCLQVIFKTKSYEIFDNILYFFNVNKLQYEQV